MAELTDIPNIGPKIAARLRRLGIESPEDLRGQDAEDLFERTCADSGFREDPCLLDTYRAAVDFADGKPAARGGSTRASAFRPDNPRVEVRPGTPDDGVASFLAAHNADRAARKGELVDALAQAHLIAGELHGVLTYVIDGTDCEVLTLHAEPRHARRRDRADRGGRGARRRGGLHAPVADHHQRQRRRAALLPAPRLPAHTLHAGAVDDSRARLKPQIPEIGDHGIPLRDELELELLLAP